MSEESSDFSAIVISWLNLASYFNFPAISPVVSIISPVLQRIIEKGFSIFDRDSTAKIECARLGIAYQSACERINMNIKSGKQIRDDGFIDALNSSKYTSADEIIEAILRNTIHDAESWKSNIYGRFLGNMLFMEHLPKEILTQHCRTVSQLSKDDIELLHILNDNKKHNFISFEDSIRNNPDNDSSHYFYSLLHLKSLGLLIQYQPFPLGYSIGIIKCSLSGQQIDEILSLESSSIHLTTLTQKYDTLSLNRNR